MSEYLRRFLRDYPTVANAPHIYSVESNWGIQTFLINGLRQSMTEPSSVVTIRSREASVEIRMPMSEVGEFLQGLEFYKMGES